MPKIEKKRTLTKTLRLVRKILASYTANCNFHRKSNFSSRTLILTNSFAESELDGVVCLRFAPKREKKQSLTKTLRLQILASCTGNCIFHHKSNFSSRTLTLTNSFAESELDGLVCLRFVPKIQKNRTLTTALRLVGKILASYTANCNFYHKPNFSSKTLILTKSFADSNLVGLVCLCFAPKTEKKQTLTKKFETTNFSVFYWKL